MGQRMAYLALVMIFAMPLQAVGVYFFQQAKKKGRKSLAGGFALEMGWVFSCASYAVIGLGIIGCFV